MLICLIPGWISVWLEIRRAHSYQAFICLSALVKVQAFCYSWMICACFTVPGFGPCHSVLAEGNRTRRPAVMIVRASLPTKNTILLSINRAKSDIISLGY